MQKTSKIVDSVIAILLIMSTIMLFGCNKIGQHETKSDDTSALPIPELPNKEPSQILVEGVTADDINKQFNKLLYNWEYASFKSRYVDTGYHTLEEAPKSFSTEFKSLSAVNENPFSFDRTQIAHPSITDKLIAYSNYFANIPNDDHNKEYLFDHYLFSLNFGLNYSEYNLISQRAQQAMFIVPAGIFDAFAQKLGLAKNEDDAYDFCYSMADIQNFSQEQLTEFYKLLVEVDVLQTTTSIATYIEDYKIN